MGKINKKLAIVIPTFNEKDNLEFLVKAIKKYTTREDKIVIVDDNSPDGTGKLADSIAKKNKEVFVIHRKGKGGRGSAVIDGFKFAKKFAPDFYIEMDADFSHKPGDIPRLVTEIGKGSDIVIGSRYLPKSEILNWPPQRKIFSRFANFYASIILGVPISDYTNGFRIYSKGAMDHLLSQDLISKGYIVLSETAYKLHRENFKFAEIAITFVNRKRGQSNTTFAEIKNAYLGVLKIRFPKVFNR